MTEAEWLTATDPTPMLKFLSMKASDRKLQLFGSACRLRIPARTATRWESLRRGGMLPETAIRRGQTPSESALRKELVNAIFDAKEAIAIMTCVINRKADKQTATVEEQKAQCRLLRDIFGDPFRPVTLKSSWLTSTVLTLVQQIWNSRNFSTMPILADALQDAGCDNEDILNHCRQPGEHARGCFVVDLLLAKG
jgi:hypothetical protein